MAENKTSPLKIAPWLIAAGVGALGIGLNAMSKAKRRDRSNQAKLAGYEQEFDERIADYEKSTFKPLDADALKQENVYEDLTVDTQAADYAREQFQQQQANIMQGLKGVAGGSGVAGLAQSLSNQAAKQSQQSQLTIGQQLQQNRRMQMQEKSRLQGQERQVQLANMEGARQFELDKMSTLMGVAGQKISGTQGAIAQRQQMYGQIAGGVGQVAAAAIPLASDRKLKKDISLIGQSPSGLNVYNFKYKDESFGSGTFQGVMSDEIPSHAVVQGGDYDMVDYSKIDVDFKQI